LGAALLLVGAPKAAKRNYQTLGELFRNVEGKNRDRYNDLVAMQIKAIQERIVRWQIDTRK